MPSSTSCDERPVIVCGLAVDHPEAIWEVLSLPFLAGSSETAMPTETPWLAVLIRENGADLFWLVHFEWCLAWAILEAEPFWPEPPS
jgi:hypothetical protein